MYLQKNHSLGRNKFLSGQEKIFLCAGKNKSGTKGHLLTHRENTYYVNKKYSAIKFQVSLKKGLP